MYGNKTILNTVALLDVSGYVVFNINYNIFLLHYNIVRFWRNVSFVYQFQVAFKQQYNTILHERWRI